MTKRLVWNFEFLTEQAHPINFSAEQAKEKIKWESRFFWTDEQTIQLNLIDPNLLDLGCYDNKQKQDYYFLIPQSPYNIKKRRGHLLYKPLLKQAQTAMGFGPKVNLDEDLSLSSLRLQVQKNAQEIEVLKESFTFSFPTKPRTKLELARLQVHNKIYFSLCVEGRSLYWVEAITQHLLNGYPSCDYVRFLNQVLNHGQNPIEHHL